MTGCLLLKAVDVDFEWGEPIRELAVFSRNCPWRFVKHLALRNGFGQAAELDLRRCPFAFTGQDKQFGTHFPRAKLQPRRAARFDRQGLTIRA